MKRDPLLDDLNREDRSGSWVVAAYVLVAVAFVSFVAGWICGALAS